MTMSRRRLLRLATLAPIAALAARSATRAQPVMAAAASELPPIVFVHGNGDYAALWSTLLWRFEANGAAPARLTALDFTDPSARSDDAVAQAGRSSTEDQLREITAVIDATRNRTGAAKVALVGNSRGGYPIRNYIAAHDGANVSHAVLCGVPNHGVFDWAENPGSEFNGRGPFLRRLNGGDSEVVPGVAVLTLRSDGNDKYAQPDGGFVGRKGGPTGITFEGPTLRGATNIALRQLDHRELAFHPRAFREIFRFIAGREPERIDIDPEPLVTLDGLVTGALNGTYTNRPLAGATLEIHRVSRETGERQGEPVHRRLIGADGRWGPLTAQSDWALEFTLAADGYPTTHIYRSPFPRSSSIVHVRPGRALGPADTGAGAVLIMSRPRGYFGIPRDVVLFDGAEPGDVAHGVPGDSTSTLRLQASEIGRPVSCVFNEERIVARAWPASENRLTIAELTY
ncbi:Lipase (class 2) [Rhizobiales bacterium GAS188]|nr:Lipase (class 2) [Rhizobiales bacterium GAS188]